MNPTKDEQFQRWFEQAAQIPLLGAYVANANKQVLKLAWLDGYENGYSIGHDEGVAQEQSNN